MDNPEKETQFQPDPSVGTPDSSLTEDTSKEAATEAPTAASHNSSESPSQESELAAKSEEIQNLNDKYLRLAAEFENYKRRAQRDQSDTVRFANEKLLKDLIPTIDNLERAISCGREQNDSKGLLEGIELTYKQFLDTLEKLGVKQVASIGEPFDPARHQAVGQVESETVAENFVVDEYQKGYFLQDRILRPAMVTVAKPASGDNASATQEESS